LGRKKLADTAKRPKTTLKEKVKKKKYSEEVTHRTRIDIRLDFTAHRRRVSCVAAVCK